MKSKATELREMTVSDLQDELLASTRELFNLRMSHAVGSLGKSHLLTQVRRKIARVKTIISEKQASEKKS